MTNYGHKLQDLRRQGGLNQTEAAALLGFKWYTPVHEIETGKREPSPQVRMLINLWSKDGADALRRLR